MWDGKRMRKIVYKTPRTSDFDILSDLLFKETRQMFPQDRLLKKLFSCNQKHISPWNYTVVSAFFEMLRSTSSIISHQ